MMRRTLGALGLGLMLAGPAAAEALAPLDSGAGVPTCGEFRALDMPRQITALASIEPLGDAIDAADQAAAEAWAKAVAQACGNASDRPLADAAAEALARP